MPAPPPPLVILALGSPHGDDQVAWRIAERLTADSRFAPFVHCLASPWELLDYVKPDCALVVIDACRGAAVPGSVVVLTEHDLAQLPALRSSSHGPDLAAILGLARQLRGPLKQLEIIAVEVVDCTPGAPLSPSVSMAVDRAVELVHQRYAPLPG